MSDDTVQQAPLKSSDELAQERTDLAYERTALANDRTLMAWMRTSVSLVSFGFTLYKFLSEVRKAEDEAHQSTYFTPRIVGMVLIGMGFIGLFFAFLQYRADMKTIKANLKVLPKSFAPYLAIMIMVFALMLFLAALFRQ